MAKRDALQKAVTADAGGALPGTREHVIEAYNRLSKRHRDMREVSLFRRASEELADLTKSSNRRI